VIRAEECLTNNRCLGTFKIYVFIRDKMKAKPLKDALLSVRLPTALKVRILNAQAVTRVPISTLVMESMEATCDYIETHGEIRIPFKMVPGKELKMMKEDSQNPGIK